jgi:N-acetylglucosaminyldiphosphoundecaprenol N-acetyl-beta-D-mannosaminyltransferase
MAENRTRVRLLGVEIDPLRMGQAVEQVLAWTRERPAICRYVVTPNVDHVVLLRHHIGLRAAYKHADLILADGAPVVWAARFLNRPLPEKVPGSDLVPALFAAVPAFEPRRVFLLGAGPGVAERAAARITERWPAVKIAGCYSPPMGFEKDAAENENILARIAQAAPDILVVGLGAPKQELWVHHNRNRIQASAALCVGATIDFLAGEKPRAPIWMRRSGLEWLHRVWMEPRRLAARYARDAWVFPQLVLSDWWRGRREPSLT